MRAAKGLATQPSHDRGGVHSFLAGDHVVATGSDMIGSQWVQTPRHGDPIASTAGAIGGEGSFVAGI
jgi:hypothetical protein